MPFLRFLSDLNSLSNFCLAAGCSSTGNPDTVKERIDKLFDKLDPTGELRKRNRG